MIIMHKKTAVLDLVQSKPYWQVDVLKNYGGVSVDTQVQINPQIKYTSASLQHPVQKEKIKRLTACAFLIR